MILAMSVTLALGCDSQGEKESCSIIDQSKDNCYKNDGTNKDGSLSYINACFGDQKCKSTKPIGTSDDYCFSECYTPTCCSERNCDTDQYCTTNPYDSNQCICEYKPIRDKGN